MEVSTIDAILSAYHDTDDWQEHAHDTEHV